MQFVRMINEDQNPYSFYQNNKKRVLQPQEEAMVPWDLACSLFGDPALMDTNKDPARTRVWRQVAGYHNYEEGTNMHGPFEDHIPRIRIFDVETGTEVFMVLFDRDGIKSGMNPGMETNQEQNEAFLRAKIAEMERNQARMLEALLAMQAAQQTQGQVVVPSQDAPPSAEAFPDLPPAPEATITNTEVTSVSTTAPADVRLEVTEDTPQAVPVGTHLAPRPTE